jgi:hypothetical protein
VGKMIILINKLLAIFQLKLVSTKPVDLIQESVKYMNTLSPEELRNDNILSSYVGDINYVMDKNDKTYFRQEVGTGYKYLCDYDGDENVSFEKMYKETDFTEEQMREKLTN